MPSGIPISASYRLQFHRDFTFHAAAQLLGYLCDLGITHIYASPILRSRPGSTHGYDVIDPTRWNPELSSQPDFHLFCEQLLQRRMGLLLDILPNHLAATPENARWHNIFTGENLLATPISPSTSSLPIAGLFRHFPAAMLARSIVSR